MLVSSRGGRAACLDAKLCGFFRADRMLPLPWPSALALQTVAVRARSEAAACGGRDSRPVTIFFRGRLGSTKETQEVRVRIPLLRGVSGAQVAIVGSDRLLPSAGSFAAKNGMGSVHRLRRLEGEAYAKALLRAKYCLVPPGDVRAPSHRLYDAIAAGCVPILVGINTHELPLARQLRYTAFSASLSRSAFLKDPLYACEALIHRLEPAYAAMRRALADARPRLLYGVSDSGQLPDAQAPNASVPSPFGELAGMLLREHRMAVLEATPAAVPWPSVRI